MRVQHELIKKIIDNDLMHRSVINSFFHKDEEGIIDDKYFKKQYFYNVANGIINLSSILVQGYYISTKIRHMEQYDIADIIKILWKGHCPFSNENHRKVLYCAVEMNDYLIVKPDFIVIYEELKRKFEDAENIQAIKRPGSRENFGELLIRLIETLPILEKTKIDVTNDVIRFNVNEMATSISMKPFILFYKKNHLQRIGVLACNFYLPNEVSIDTECNEVTISYRDAIAPAEYKRETIDIDDIVQDEDNKKIIVKSIFEAVGVRFRTKKIIVNSSYEFLFTLISIVTRAHAIDSPGALILTNGRKEKIDAMIGIINYYTEGLEKHSINIDDYLRENNPSIEDLENAFWPIVLKIGVDVFIRRAMKKMELISLLRASDERKMSIEESVSFNTDLDYVEKYRTKVEKYKNDVKSTITSKKSDCNSIFPEGSLYEIEKSKYLNDYVNTTCFLAYCGYDKMDIMPDYTKLVTIEDYISTTRTGGNLVFLFQVAEAVLKFLYCFYNGVFAYCKFIDEGVGCNYKSISAELDSNAEKLFLKKAKEKFKLMSNERTEVYNNKDMDDEKKACMYLTGLTNRLQDLFGEMDKSGISERYFGRSEFMKNGVFEEIFEFIKERNGASHFSINCKFTSDEEMLKMKEDLLEVLMYFKTGFQTSETKSMKYCIYPQVVSLKETTLKRSNINIVGYESYKKQGDGSFENSAFILTKQSISPFKEYYCIPHAKRSNKDFLIEPFLLNCDDFDENAPIAKVKM